MEFKKKIKKRRMLYIVFAVIGAVILALSCIKEGMNEFFGAYGAGIMALGILKSIRYSVLLRDEARLTELGVAEKDERTVMLVERARSNAFVIYNMLAAIAVIVLEILNLQHYASVLACTVMVQMLLYVISFKLLSRKF